jgi:thymidylate synthase (FAD)
MLLVRPSYEILTSVSFVDVLRMIETAGRTCYKSEDKITEDSAAEFVRRMVRSGHHSVIEHYNLTVRFMCDRGVTHELVRHRLASYSQESTRYCDYSGGHVAFVIPPWVNIEEGEYTEKQYPRVTNDAIITCAEGEWFYSMLDSEASYKRLREAGWKPQEARSVLPNSLKTEIVVTANLREWRHILKLRTSKAAHPQIREVMLPLLDKLYYVLWELFEDIYETRNV